MIDKPLFKRSLFIFFVISILNWMGLFFYLHWTIWWFDVFLHFLGGFCAVCALLSLNYFRHLSFRKTFVIALIGVFCIGVLWEIFELIIGGTSFSDGSIYWFDTVSDLILDIGGGMLGVKYSLKDLTKSKIPMFA